MAVPAQHGFPPAKLHPGSCARPREPARPSPRSEARVGRQGTTESPKRSSLPRCPTRECKRRHKVIRVRNQAEGRGLRLGIRVHPAGIRVLARYRYTRNRSVAIDTHPASDILRAYQSPNQAAQCNDWLGLGESSSRTKKAGNRPPPPFGSGSDWDHWRLGTIPSGELLQCMTPL